MRGNNVSRPACEVKIIPEVLMDLEGTHEEDMEKLCDASIIMKG